MAFARAATTPKKRRPLLRATAGPILSSQANPIEAPPSRPRVPHHSTGPQIGDAPPSGGFTSPTGSPAPGLESPAADIKPPTAPPVTLAGQNIRNNAWTTFINSINNTNKSMFDAAMRFGDPTVLKDPGYARYLNGQDPSKMDLSMGQLGQISHQLGADKYANDQARNASGTYFSGFHGQDQNVLNTQADQDRVAALDEYNAAMTTLRGELAKALGTVQGAGSDADRVDLEAALALDPQPTGVLGGDNPGPATSKPQQTTSRAGSATSATTKPQTTTKHKPKKRGTIRGGK